jgi:O-antigen/teichoic acid export membrane protein
LRITRRLATNVVWNWTGTGIMMLAGFVTTPYLVRHLGEGVYGLWILIASMTGYFGLLDLGVRSSVGRYIAFYRARGEQEKVNATLSTAVTILSGVAVLVLLATFAVLLLFFHLFDVPPEQVGVAKWAILIVGINLAITFPISVFDGVLWGFERFDLLNAIDIPIVILRTALTFWLVREPHDILLLAWITLASTCLSEVAKLTASFSLDHGLRVTPRLFRREQAGHLYGYGLWQLLLQIARQINGQVGTALIGALVSVTAVTPFSLATRLIGYAGQFMVAATGVLTPLATALHATKDGEGERRLFIEGGRWCTVFALYVTIGQLLLGRPFLNLWIGKPSVAEQAAPVLMVMVLGEALAMSQWLAYSILMGKARHRAVALSSLVETAIAAAGGAIAGMRWGVLGVAVVFAVAGLLCRGVFLVLYACRLMELPVKSYALRAILTPLGVSLVPATLLEAAVYWRSPESWFEFAAYAVGFSVVFGGINMWMLGAMRYLPARWGRSWREPVMEKAHV